METQYLNVPNVFRTTLFALALVVATALPPTVSAESPQPVLMVIANRDFYYQEYADTRASLEAAGLEVVVAAATTDTAIPHRVRPRRYVIPNLPLSDVNAEDYSAIVFVGGWGASAYQYAFEGTYDNPAYGPDRVAADLANRLIVEFSHQKKYVAAICHGVSVLAWARVDGVSPIAGRTVVAWAGTSPAVQPDSQYYPEGTEPTTTREHVEGNGATMLHSAEARNPVTSSDDVIVDGRIITAENYDSASYFGKVLAKRVINWYTR